MPAAQAVETTHEAAHIAHEVAHSVLGFESLGVGNPMLTLSIVLIAGIVGGALAKKLGAPSITGQIIIGAILGPSVIGVLHPEALHGLRPLTLFSLGLIAVAVGNHLNFRALRKDMKRLGLLLLFEMTLTPALVFGAMQIYGVDDLSLGLMFATMAVATAPATVVAIVSETGAKGSFVRTLVAGVALNNMACILLFEIARSFAREQRSEGGELADMILGVGFQILGPVVVGLFVGLLLIGATRKVARSDHLVSASVVAILFATGLASFLDVSPLLSCLFLGITLANVTPDKDEIGHQVFDDFEHAIFAVFFTLAGMELNFAYLVPAGLLSLCFVGARILGKVGSAKFAMSLDGAPKTLQNYLGMALIPQAGVAVGLVFAVQEDPLLTDVAELFLAVGITAVTMNEIIGPITTRFALRKSGETEKNRGFVDLLQAEHIETGLGAISLAEAVGKLTDRLVEKHAPNFDPSSFRADALLSLEESAYAGDGLSIPHVIVDGEERLMAVMGTSEKGLTSDSGADAVHGVVLLAIPDRLRARSLEIVTAFSKAIAHDPILEQAIFQAESPERVLELLHSATEATVSELFEELASA